MQDQRPGVLRSTPRRLGLGLAGLVGLPLLAVALDAGAWAERELRVDRFAQIGVGVDTLGELQPPTLGPHAGSHGSTIVVDAHGLLVVEREEGVIVRASREGEPIAQISVAPGLGEIVRDAANGRVFVADRRGNRVVEIAAGDAEGRGLGIRGSVPVREPHALALSPDASTLLVTSVADHELVALDLVGGELGELRVAWRAPLGPEPRGVAISPDGRQAIVGFLSMGAVALITLPEADGRPRVDYRSLEPRDQLRFEVDDFEDFVETRSSEVEAKSRFEVPTETGRRYARNTFAVAFVGHGLAVAAHQLATPQLTRRPADTGTYGGGESFSPINHKLSMIEVSGLSGGAAGVPASAAQVEQATLGVEMPRALAYDLARDTLYVAGYGDDDLQALGEVSQRSVHGIWQVSVGDRDDACGVDGLALDGDALWVHCEFGRKLIRLELAGEPGQAPTQVMQGAELAAAIRDPEVEHGAELFRRAGDSRITSDGTLACAMCHPEGRADGLTWRLEGAILQTPMLAGRLSGTAPYKWDGQDRTLADSLRNTIGRLGGFPESMRQKELRALRAYLESLSPPQTPTAHDPEAIARGRAVFESEAAGCDACHEGGRLSDGNQHDLSTSLDQVDTPSLLGLAHSAPYYHDGSALSIDALLANRATIHAMADTSGLTPAQLADLTTYLESL